MKMKLNHNFEYAVSPVIGVLLMLVVTIIIAAIVSGFAGGLTGGADKIPKATISGEYIQNGYMSVSHTGGDSLSTRNTRLVVRLSNEFCDVDYMSWDVNKTVITNTSSATPGSANAWVKTGGVTGIGVWKPGETMYVPAAGLPYIQTTSVSQTYWLNNTANLGKSFWIELYDVSGKMIAKTQAKITS